MGYEYAEEREKRYNAEAMASKIAKIKCQIRNTIIAFDLGKWTVEFALLYFVDIL